MGQPVGSNDVIYLWEILVPCQWNNGHPVRTRHHKVWDARIRAISGGLTILSPAKGQWLSPDKELYQERMIPVRVACTHRQIELIMDITAQHYKQLAVMAYVVSETVMIKNYPEGYGHTERTPKEVDPAYDPRQYDGY